MLTGGDSGFDAFPEDDAAGGFDAFPETPNSADVVDDTGFDAFPGDDSSGAGESAWAEF